MATLEQRDNNIEYLLDLTIRLIGFQINSSKKQSYPVFIHQDSLARLCNVIFMLCTPYVVLEVSSYY